MKLVPTLIIFSLAANALLGGWWLMRRTSVAAGVPVVSQKRDAPRPRKAKPLTAPGPVVSEAVQPTVLAWKDIHKDDLKALVASLRAVQCPELTVQDIILAEVNRRYQAKTREIWPERFAVKPYWEVEKRDPEQSKKNRERSRQDRELQKEKSALLVELLGVDPEKLRREEEGLDHYLNWQEQRVSFLPEAKRADVARYLEEFEEKRQEYYERNRGLHDDESRAEQKKMEADLLKGLAQFLSPQELREYELRNSQTATQLSHDLRYLSLNREQYEAIFDIRKKYGNSIYNYGDLDAGGRQRVEETKKAMNAELAAALGPQAGKEYERSQDYSYQQLTQLARRYDLPAGTAGKVYDYKAVAEQTVKTMREDTTLTPEQRQAALTRIREETEQTVKATLGEENFKRYLRSGGYWINNLAPTLPRPRP